MVDISECLQELAVVEAIMGNESRATRLWAAASALQKRIGFTYPTNDPLYLQAPATWVRTAPCSKEWTEGEMMAQDRAIAFALEGENG
jgi:hypothetical protein